MLTTFDQVKDWITDNGFKRWVLYKDFTRKEKIIDSAAFTVSDLADKIAMTEKYLRWAGGNAYAAGANRMGEDDLTTITEIRLADVQPAQPTQGVGGGYSNIGELRSELTETITKQIRAEMQVEDMKRREKDLEEREKEFAEKQNGVLGAIVGYLSPYLPALNKGLEMRRQVAGTEASQHIIAADTDNPLQPEAPEQKPETENPFTDEEADEVFVLMVRFKKAEPDYLPMLRKVVDMAEKNDSTYQMARNFLK